MNYKVLLVGGGLTSALTSAFLRKRFKDLVHVVIWEEGSDIGGRMRTSANQNKKCLADLGAQFFSIFPEHCDHSEVYETLIKSNLLLPLTAHIEGMRTFSSGVKHFVAPNGSGSIVRFFIHANEVHCQRKVSSVSKQNKKLIATTTDGITDIFDSIIFTIPVPCILEVGGTIRDHIDTNQILKANLSAVEYSSRYALGLMYSEKVSLNVPWGARFLYDDDVFRFVAIDNRKRNQENELPSCVFHTTVEFGKKYVGRQQIAAIKNQLLSHVQTRFTFLPPPDSVMCCEWKYSQTVKPYPNSKGCIILLDEPLIILGGDSFTVSTMEGCITSAKYLTSTFGNKLFPQTLRT